jgi:uncharacterized membrane protein HdeD (DUF308 family)
MPKITMQMVEYWVGSDTLRSGIIEILYELANGEYEVEQMIQDIIETNDGGF